MHLWARDDDFLPDPHISDIWGLPLLSPAGRFTPIPPLTKTYTYVTFRSTFYLALKELGRADFWLSRRTDESQKNEKPLSTGALLTLLFPFFDLTAF